MHDGTSPPRTPALPRFAAQWYGLASLFGPIRIASHRITAASNPAAVVELELRNRYTVRLVGTTHGIASTVRILTDAARPNNDDANAKIDRVEDRWEGKLPGGAVAEVRRHDISLGFILEWAKASAWGVFCWGAWQWPSWVRKSLQSHMDGGRDLICA